MKHSDISDAARLVRYALKPKDRPMPAVHIGRCSTGTEPMSFSEIVDRIADGLGLDVHQVSQLGLLLSGRLDGPFAVTLDNAGLSIRKGSERTQDRFCFGLVLVALAALAYPTVRH